MSRFKKSLPYSVAETETFSLEALQEKLAPALPYLKDMWGRTHAWLDENPRSGTEEMAITISAYERAQETCNGLIDIEQSVKDVYMECVAVPKILTDFAKNCSDASKKQEAIKAAESIQKLYDDSGFMPGDNDGYKLRHWSDMCISARPPA